MISFLLDAFYVTQYITNPISLAAFAIAAIMTYLISRNVNGRKKIESANPNDRANVIIQIAKRLHIDLKDIPASERAQVIYQVLKTRIRTLAIIASVVLVLGLTIAFLYYDNKKKEGKVIVDKGPKKDGDSTNANPDTSKKKNQDTISITTIDTIKIAVGEKRSKVIDELNQFAIYNEQPDRADRITVKINGYPRRYASSDEFPLVSKKGEKKRQLVYLGLIEGYHCFIVKVLTSK